MKKVGIAVAVLIVLLVGARIGLGVMGANQLAEIEERWTKDVAAHRERISKLRQPVVRGTPLDENGADRYKRALAAIEKAKDVSDKKGAAAIGDAVKGGVRKTLAPAAVEILDSHRSEIALVRQGTRCTRCDWQLEWDRGFAMQMPPLAPARLLANLLIIEGHERAQAGDARGAYERYVDAARFGCDLAACGSLITSMSGVGVCDAAFRAIGDLATFDRKGEPKPLAAADAELAKLEPSLPSLADAIGGERVVMKGLCKFGSLSEAGVAGSEGSPAEVVLPGKWILANAINTMDPCLGEIEEAAADAKRRRAVCASVESRLAESKNPIVYAGVPPFTQVVHHFDELLARHHLARAAIAIERGAVALRYPRTIDLPADPCDENGAKLRYKLSADELGYKVWSVGQDGKDDGGKPIAKDGDPGDIVLERVSPEEKK
jgi:hypothetical protein